MSNNLDIWERFADIDPKFTKPISGRDYGGTSPNPQYVIRCLTEMFGPVGKGFGWSVLAEDFKELGGTYLHWCRIKFWWKDEEGTHGVEEYGQTKAAYVTSTGKMRVDEDAPKKSLTDAIVKGASHVGVAANIFLGRWDDQKYVAEVNQEYRREERAAKADIPQPANDKPKSSASLKRDGTFERIREQLAQDMLDVGTFSQFEVVKEHYRAEAKKNGWNNSFLFGLSELFGGYEVELQKRIELENAQQSPLTAGA